MQIERNITWGNIVSWTMIIVGLAMGYAKLESATNQNMKDVATAISLAQKVDETTRAMDAARNAQVQALITEVAVTKVIIGNMDKKLDELVKNSNPKRLTDE